MKPIDPEKTFFAVYRVRTTPISATLVITADDHFAATQIAQRKVRRISDVADVIAVYKIGYHPPGLYKNFQAIAGPDDGFPITSVSAIDAPEAIAKITELLDRPGRVVYLNHWIATGRRIRESK